MTDTNIKNLPEGKTYFTEIGYSQTYPWVEVRRTKQTVILAKVNVGPDPEWAAKKQFIPGGFCGHTPNQHEQTWIFDKINEEHTVRVHKTKRGWSHKNVRFVEGQAREFYDYNF